VGYRGRQCGFNTKHQSTKAPRVKDHPLDTHREPSALYCWILEILFCTPKGHRALLRIPSTEGRSVCLCLHRTAGSSRSITAIRKNAGLCCGSRLRSGEVFAYVWRNQNLKDLKDVGPSCPCVRCSTFVLWFVVDPLNALHRRCRFRPVRVES
jgi:hypothetical protein